MEWDWTNALAIAMMFVAILISNYVRKKLDKNEGEK